MKWLCHLGFNTSSVAVTSFLCDGETSDGKLKPEREQLMVTHCTRLGGKARDCNSLKVKRGNKLCFHPKLIHCKLLGREKTLHHDLQSIAVPCTSFRSARSTFNFTHLLLQQSPWVFRLHLFENLLISVHTAKGL